jgi:thiol-disulfide isomerase/thioredoxin
MKNRKRLILIAFCTLTFSAHAQNIDRTFANVDGSSKLLGLTSIERLQQAPFDSWYSEFYDSYEVGSEVASIANLPDSITLFMGTWCGDSKREVPRFIKMLESINYDLSKLKIINVNTGFQNYKQAPERQEAGQYIHHVPTFIMHGADDKEIGRIVQQPVVSLEADFKAIALNEGYKPYFVVAEAVVDLLKNSSIKTLKNDLGKIAAQYKGKTVSESELRNLGYILWSSFDLEKAEIVFELNALLYPESPYSLGQLCNFKFAYGKQKEAQSNLKKGLKVDPKNEYLLGLQSKLEARG